jgi:glycine dehydrogenase subunit 2
MEVMAHLESALLEITGMDAVTLQPAAGAHGELTGILLIRALLERAGQSAQEDPDSGFRARHQSRHRGHRRLRGREHPLRRTGPDGSRRAGKITWTEDVAGADGDQPQHAGRFRIAHHRSGRILHRKGALLYMDGANMNALVGIARPGDFGVDVMHLNLHKTFSTPHGGGGPGGGPVAVKKHLEPFLPVPRLKRVGDAWTFDYDRPQSIGKVRAFYGNFGVLVRALAYILAHGGNGLRAATMDAVLNANYIRKKLEPYFDLPYALPNMHEVVFSDDRQARLGRAHRRYRQAPDRLRIPPLHRQLPADRAWRHDDRAHRNRRQAGAGPVHRRHDLHRQRDRNRAGDGEDRAALDPHQPRG